RGLQASLDAGGAQPLGEAFVERAIGVEVALPERVLHEVVAQLVGLGLLDFERAAGLLLVVAGGNIGLMGLIEQPLLFVADLLVDLVDLGGERLDLRMVRTLCGAELCVPGQQLVARTAETTEACRKSACRLGADGS